jgi:hypothetical protein
VSAGEVESCIILAKMENMMSKEASALLQILLASRIDAAGVHCVSPDDDPDDGDGDPDKTPGDDPYKPSPSEPPNKYYA